MLATITTDWITASATVAATVGALIAAYISLGTLQTSLDTQKDQVQSNNEERVHRLTDRLYELDQLIMQYSDIQKFVKEYASNESYFTAAHKDEDRFYKVEAFILFQINFFDEIFTLMEGDIELQEAFEFKSWKVFIEETMKNPLFREVYWRKPRIWGDRFYTFCEEKIPKPVATAGAQSI